MHEITLEDLSRLGSQQIELFLDYLSFYSKPGEDEEFQNGERGKARKISAVRSLFKYFYKKELLPANPAQLVSTPKIHDKNIIRLDTDEIARMLDEVESGEKLTERQQKYHGHRFCNQRTQDRAQGRQSDHPLLRFRGRRSAERLLAVEKADRGRTGP